MDDNIKKLHQALIDDGYDDVGTEQEFRDYVSDSKNVATLYNALSEAGYDNFKDQKSLETYLSAKAPVAQKPSTPQSSGQSVYSKEKKQTQYPQEVLDAYNSPDNKPGNFKDLAQLNDEYQRGVLKKPGIISQVLGMMPKVDAGNIGREQKVGGMIANMLLGDNMQQPQQTQQLQDNNQQVQQPAQQEASPESKEENPVTAPTSVVNNEGLMDAKLANYLENWKQRPDKQGTYFENMVADLLADGTANSNEEAVSMVQSALGRYANRSAMDVTNQVVASLPDDTVQDAEQSIEAQWYSHGVQDKLKQEADSMGISYDDYVAKFLKPAMVQSLVNKYGPNYRNIAEGIATRLYSHDENVQDRLMNQDINDALSSVISKYVNPSVVDEYNKAQEAGSKAFTEGMEGSQFIPANLRLGTALGAQYEANEAKDPAKVLSSLQKKFGRLYRNPEFLNDMSNAAFKVMQRYGLNGTQSSDPKQFKPMINSVLKNELDQLEIKGMMPKGSAEYIMKTGLGNTIVGKITRKAVQTDYQNWLEDIANQQYQPGFWENVASGALTFAGDAWSYWLPGAAGGKLTKSMVAKAEGKLAGDLMAKGMERKMAERAAKVLIGKSKAAALKSGAVHGAVTFGGQSAISKPIDEVYRTGQFDENGKIYNPSGWKIALDTLLEGTQQSALGVIMQGNTIANMLGKGRGLATNILADVGGKVVDSGIMTGHQILERMAQDPNFKPTGKDAAESFLESMANLTAIGLPGMVGKYARFKDAREFNKKFDFTDQDIAELKRFGYDGLRDAFEKMGIGEYAVVGENAQRLDGQLTQKYMDLMNDKSVPEVLKAKMMAVVEGKRPSSFSPVIDSEVYRGDDGKYYLETYSKDGGVIDRKEYSSHDAARNDEKKLEYEKTLGLASVLEGEFHNEFTQEHLEGLYNKAAQKYNMGEKLTDEDKTAVYLHQNAGAIKEIMDKQQKGIILTDEEQKQVNAYRHYYDSALENSSVMREFVNTFEDSHDVAHGTLRKALESKDKKYSPLVESYLKELYNSIELKREMKQTMDDFYNTSHGNEQKRIEGENPVSPVESSSESSAGGQELPVSEGPAPYQDRTNSVPTPSDAEFAANSANLANENQSESKASDAFVMGQNAYKNGDTEGLKSIKYNAETAELRLKRAFANDTDRIQGVYNAVNKGTDIETYIEQRTNYLTPFQQEAIRKYAEAMDANKGAMDALEHADDGYADKLKQQLSQYTMENGNISSLTLTDGQRGYWKSKNEHGAGFGVFPDANGQPVVKQVPSSQVKENGKEITLQEYVNQLATQKHEATKKNFNAIFDATSLKPNDTVSLSINDKDQPTEAKIVSVNPDGTISFNIAGSKNVTTVPVDTFNKFQKYALRNSINAELDAEDAQRANDDAAKAEADKKQRYANGIVGLSEGQPDYSSKDTDPNVAAEYLQEQFGEDHGKLLNLVNGSRDDIKTQLDNKKKAAAEYQDWLDTNADLDLEKAKKVEDELSLVNEQIADLDARFKNWNTIRNSVMTPDEVKAMKEERKADVEKAGVDESAIVPSDDFHVLVLDDKELKKQYPTMDEATDYITSQRKDIYHTQEDVERKINGVNDMLDQYINGETELDPSQLMELNTTKAQLEALQTNLSVAAKGLKAQANKLSRLYKTEVSKQEMEKLGMTPSEQRKALVADALKKNDMNAIHDIYKDASVDVMDLTPQTLEEAVSESLLPHSLNPESLQYELGKSNFKFGIGKGYDSNKFNYLIAKKGTGMSVNEFAVRVYNDLPVNLQDMGYTDQDVRNALLDMFKSYDSVKEMRNVALMNRIAAAEDELSSEEEYYEAQKEREIIERQAEIEKYNSFIHEKELSLPSESELDHIYGLEYDRMMEIEDREREYKQYVKSILPELADYDDRSNDKGYGGSSSLGSDSSRRGVDEGNSQGEEVGNGEASSESEIGEGSDSGRKGRQETGSLERGEGSAVRGSHLPQETSFGERLKSAIAETETEITEAQKKAGNYKKGHLSFGGYDYTVETPKGVTRSGKDEQGKPWSVTMHDTYGYILGKIGVDGDHIDMFINDAADLDTFDGNVYVVDQVNPETGEFDEHKVMYGYPSEEAATEAYLANYSKDWKGLGKVTAVPKATFDKWLESSDRKTKPFAEYAMVQKEQAKFDRDVKEVKPSEMTEAQKVAYDAVSTMLKKAGIPVKVVSNEDMEKVAEAQDNLAVEMLLNDPRLRFYIKTPEQKEAAKAAYDWAAGNRPDKFKQYAIVNMDNPNQPPQYFEKKDLAEKWRKYYTNAWKIGNYKAFNLNKPFEEQIKDIKGDVPSEFDPYKAESLLNKRIELEKQIKETEDSYNAKKKERAEYQNQLMQDYMDQHGLSSENDIPDDVWTDYRDKSFEKYQDTLDDLFHKYVELDNQLKAVAEPGVQYLKGKGVVYGYTDGNEIVLNQEHLNPNTPIHEYQHLWRTAAKEMNPELIEHGDKLIMQTQLFADLKQDPNYNHLTDEQICDEAFARLTGEDGAAILEQMAKDAIKENPLDTAKGLSVINKLKEWLKKFWYWTLDTFTKWKPEDIKKMTLEDIRNLVLRDLANGVDPRTKLHEAENADDIKFMGSTTKKRMKDISTQLEGRELDEAQQAVADVYSGKKDNVSLTVEREDGSNKIIMRQGNDNHAGTKHSVFRHYGVKANSLNVDDLLLIPTVLKEGERKVSDNGRVAYVYVDPTSQVKYTVVTEPKNNKEFFNDFYSNKKANPSETSRVVENSTNTPEGAHNNDGNAFMDAKVDNNSETAKENDENLSVEDKIKAVSQQFGVDEADVAMYANGVKKGSTAEAARARANIKRHLLQANEDKISSFKELLKYTVPVNEALKENFGDVDAMIEERKQQMEAQRNAMEAARKRAEEEEAKRQKHLEELSLIPDDQLDKQYMDALAKGDDATAREMLDEAARRKGYDDTESSYQGVGAWKAPGNPGYESDKARRDDWESSGSDVNLEDIALGYTPQPDDYFSHPERYSQNTPHGLESVKAINTAIDAIKNGEKDVKVKVYRAVPTSVKEGKLRNGDWVTPSKKYAEMHGTNRLEGKYRIIDDEVPATQLWWDGNDANEFGFDDGKAYKYKNAKNNRKLNDLVTYDDEGDVIPPSKRFNSRKSDVRFHRSDGANLPSEEDNKPKKKTERGRIDEATGAFKLAPNGEQSNLSKKQYIEARTKNFKDWFGGDWEKKPKDFKNKLDANGEPLEKYVEGYLNRPKKPTMPKKRKGEDEATFFGRKMLYSQALEDWPKTEADWKKRIDEFDENTLAALTPPDEEAIREKYQKLYENDMASWRKDHPYIKEGEERPLEIPDMRDYQSIQDYGEALRKHEIWKTAPHKDEYDRMAEDEIISKVALMDAVQHPFSEYARLKAMKAEFQHMRHVMQNQKVYDQNTTDAVVQFAKRFMSLGYGDDLGRGSINTLLTIVKNSTGKKSYEISQQLYQVMDVLMNNQLRNFDRAVMKTMSIKELKENAKGIQVQGKLELRGQTTIKAFRDAVSSRISSDKLDERISNLIDKMAADKKNASSYQDELLGLNLAKQYVDYIDSSRNDAIEIEDLKKLEIENYKDRKGIYKGERTKALLQEHVERLNQYDEALFNNKVERMDRYSQLLANLGGMIDESVKGAREFQERDARRAINVKMMASADLGDKSMNQHHKENWKTRLSNSDVARLFCSPLGSFDALMREFGSKQINGEGQLWNHFVRGAMKASNDEFKSVREANNEIDLKVSELFGKVTEDKNGNKKGNMTLNDLYALERSNKVKSLDVTIRDIEGEQTYKLQQGNLMYIYMVNKMPDGAMKLREMRILDADVERIKENIDPRFLKLADWIQGEFLPKMRTKYNKRHEELFGAPMPMVENYFPLRVLKNARYMEEDVNNTSDNSNALPSTATGAIIKRKTNKLPLDILNADALSVTIDNIKEMENWYNYAPIRKDANTLLSDTTFRNRVQNMTTIYGSGERLWNNVKDATAVAMGTYRPKGGTDLAVSIKNIGKGITGAKISGRLYTAFKQILSFPLFLADADIGRFAWYSVNPYGSFKWAIENMPNFDKRWSGRKLGDTVLMDDPTDWKLWHTNLMEKAAYYGMTPNALVDAVTCAVGARAVYDTKYKQYIKAGLTEEKAKEKALSDAEINFNTSQQSSEGAFVSPMQLDRTLESAIFTPFRNSSMLYERKGINALRNLKHRFEKGHKEASIKYMAAQLMEEGVGYEQATKAAEKMYKKGLMHNIADAIVALWLGPIIWNLGGSLGYLIPYLGDDENKKKKMVIDAVILGLLEGPVDGLAGGQFINTAIANTITSDGISLKGLKNVDFSGMPMLSDFNSMIEKFGYDKVAGVQDLMFMVMQSSTGFNPKTLTDAINACIDYGNGDMTNAKEIALFVFRLMNGPAATVDNLYIDELGMKGKDAKKLSYEELAKRYAEYKFGKNTFGLGKLYSDEEKQKKLKAIEKSFDKIVTERLAGMDREDLKNEFSESRSQKEKKLIGKIIADELETKDSEAVKKAKADASYLRQRNFSDLMDDLYLQKEWEATNEANAGLEELKGNGASEKEIEAYKTKHKADLDKRKAIQKARKEMQKKKADISSDNDEATMAAIRKLRDSILKTVRQKKK